MTALSAMAALAGVGGLYAATPADGPGQQVVVTRDGDGPGFDIFGMGGSKVGMVVRDVETADHLSYVLAKRLARDLRLPFDTEEGPARTGVGPGKRASR
jgi:hypothetical protein